MERFISFMVKSKFKIFGVLFCLFMHLTIFTPFVLDQLINYSDGVIDIWINVGFGLFIFIVLMGLGIAIGHLLENTLGQKG